MAEETKVVGKVEAVEDQKLMQLTQNDLMVFAFAIDNAKWEGKDVLFVAETKKKLMEYLKSVAPKPEVK
jgi:hypothetical protein